VTITRQKTSRRTWAELLRLVFEVKLTCPRCGTEMKILSFITETEPIRKILAHLKEKGIDARAGPFTDCAASGPLLSFLVNQLFP
jgi:hypothetical protein